MGGELVRLAYAASFGADEQGQTLTMNERGVLLYICSTAHDGDAQPRYWGGRSALARYALGRIVPDDAKAARSIFETVRRALDGLVKRGLLERVGDAHPGRNQEYVIRRDALVRLGGMAQSEVGP